MKFMFLFVLILSSYNSWAAKSCGPDSVEWGQGPAKCGAQLYANGGLPIGTTQVAIDPVYAGSDAVFKCTEIGWQYISGNCAAINEKALEQCLEQALIGTPSGEAARVGKNIVALESNGAVRVYSTKSSGTFDGPGCKVQKDSVGDYIIKLFKKRLDGLENSKSKSERDQTAKTLSKHIEDCGEVLPEVGFQETEFMDRLELITSRPVQKSKEGGASR